MDKSTASPFLTRVVGDNCFVPFTMYINLFHVASLTAVEFVMLVLTLLQTIAFLFSFVLCFSCVQTSLPLQQLSLLKVFYVVILQALEIIFNLLFR